MNKELLFQLGVGALKLFTENNNLPMPDIYKVERDDRLAFINSCAWQRGKGIWIKVWDCANIGRGGPAWSYPGYVIDRTPFGVLCHELGHYVVPHLGKLISRRRPETFVRKYTNESKLTNYCPNDGEWFAEMFRLFVTNPNLLEELRPATYKLLSSYFQPNHNISWKKVLKKAPERTITQCEKKITAAG